MHVLHVYKTTCLLWRQVCLVMKLEKKNTFYQQLKLC